MAAPSVHKRATGLARSGVDLVATTVSERAGRYSWETRVFDAFFGESGSDEKIELYAPFVLVIPTHGMLRREVEAPGQDVEEFRSAVGENLGAFFPVPADEGLLWDAAEMRGEEGPGRIWLGAVRPAAMEDTLKRLGEAGLAPSRIVPSGMALALVRHLGVREPSGVVIERDGGAWSEHAYTGPRWAECGTGRGAAPAGEGAQSLDWSSGAEHEPAGGWSAASAALGGALMQLSSHAPSFNLLGRTRHRRIELPWWAGWAAAAAALVIASSILADAMFARANAALRAVESASSRVGPEALRVDEMRAQTMRIRSIEERIEELEDGYLPRWRSLAALTEATPAGAWSERVELFDSGFMMDLVVNGSPAQALASLEQSPMFRGVRQAGEPTRAGDRMRVRVDGSYEGAPADGGGGG